MKNVVAALCSVILIVGVLGQAQAAEGKFGCSLYYASRQDGAEITYTNVSFRNLGGKGNLMVEKVDIYQADGTLAAGLASGKFPSGFKTSLGPHQYTSLRLPDVVKAPPAVPGMQAIVSWKSDAADVAPIVTSVFLTFGRDPKSGAEKESRARHVLPCVPLAR